MKKRKILPIFYLLLIASCILSISFSLAWYNASAHLRVEVIELNLRTESSLKISTSSDISTFKERLEYGKDDLKKVDKFVPVSSMFSNDWIEKKQQNPEFQVCVPIKADLQGNPSYEKINYGFYSQELYLLADQDCFVGLDSELLSMLPDHEKNIDSAKQMLGEVVSQEEIEKKALELDTLARAMRISILVPDEDQYKYMIVDPYRVKNSDSKTKLGGILDTVNTGFYDSYLASNNEYYEIIYGEVNNRNSAVYEAKTGHDSQLIGEPSCFNAKTKGSVHHFNYEQSVENGCTINDETSFAREELDGADTEFRFKLKTDIPQKIVLSIYLEGWDLDCINQNMGANFISDISFKIVRHAVEGE